MYLCVYVLSYVYSLLYKFFIIYVYKCEYTVVYTLQYYFILKVYSVITDSFIEFMFFLFKIVFNVYIQPFSYDRPTRFIVSIHGNFISLPY